MVQPTIVIMTITASMTLDVGEALSNGTTIYCSLYMNSVDVYQWLTHMEIIYGTWNELM